MNVWSDYLRAQAELADRMAITTTTPEARKEFAELAGSFRRDAEIEDEMPTHPRLTMPLERSYPLASSLS